MLDSKDLNVQDDMVSFEDFQKMVLRDYRLAIESREASLLGRREVLTGKAKFGIFGDGKEVAQVALARFIQKGDYRSGYYRDQTLMFATGVGTIEQFFSQLYADTNPENEPLSGGRNMVGHFSTPNVDEEGNWLPLKEFVSSAPDMAPTSGQMPRSIGLAMASKLFRESPALQTPQFANLSDNGNEICFCTIGDAATSEGNFWEIVNAAGVRQVPLAIFVWDDGYGISVPTEKQTVKGSISEALKGMQKEAGTNGLDIYSVNGWDYAEMCEVFEAGIKKVREEQVPAIFHVKELTQPQGHSTSGSHERYKSADRLEWERAFDGIKKMKSWIIENEIATAEDLDQMQANAKVYVKKCRDNALEKYQKPLLLERQIALEKIEAAKNQTPQLVATIQPFIDQLAQKREILKRDILHSISLVLEKLPYSAAKDALRNYYFSKKNEFADRYDSNQYNEGAKGALCVPIVPAIYSEKSATLNGYEVINRYFDQLFAKDNRVVAFGEDVGKIGDVNQGFAGLQEKYGEWRIYDTGIREASIMGMGIGLACRGLRPIAEVQYLDYMLYAISTLSDDLASLHYRSDGRQSCPLIVRTRGHRLEGIWHSGSPLGYLINALRGMYVCVPRDMVQAAGMYNTLLKGNDPALMIESLNGYRLKEKMPDNIGEFTVPLGVPDILKAGDDITIVSYGSILRIAMDAVERLGNMGISCELIDVQTLLPFDVNHMIVKSLEKTNRILFLDEDMPGAASAYMYQQVIEGQNGYRWLDIAPQTLTAKNHRPAYASDGDYFSKPNEEDIIEKVLDMMAQ